MKYSTVDYSELNKKPLKALATLTLDRPINTLSISSIDSLKRWLHDIEKRMLSQYSDANGFVLQESEL